MVIVLRWTRRRLPATDRYAGVRLTTNDVGRPVVTPLFFVFLAIDTTDRPALRPGFDPDHVRVSQQLYLILAVTTVASLVAARRNRSRRAQAGTVRAHTARSRLLAQPIARAQRT